MNPYRKPAEIQPTRHNCPNCGSKITDEYILPKIVNYRSNEVILCSSICAEGWRNGERAERMSKMWKEFITHVESIDNVEYL